MHALALVIMTEPVPPPAACLNCGQVLAVPRPRFCPACGQETHVRPPTLGEFVQQFGGAYFATEGALWRTLRLLLLKPGELTAQYLAGRRKHYVLPLRLYLSISLLVLLLFRISAGLSLEATDAVQISPQEVRNGQMEIGLGRAGLKDGVFFCENLPAWVCRRLQKRIDVKPEAFVDVVRQVTQNFVGHLGAALFVLLPSFALWLKLAYFKRGLRYTEHLVFALHVHALWFVVFGCLLLPVPAVQVLLLVVPAYTLMAMKRVYGGRWGPLCLRAALVSMLYGVTLSAVMLAVGLWSFLF
jgi:Protein of unknown function (DUF3667)